MQTNTRKVLKRIGTVLLWAMVLTGFVILVAAAAHDKDETRCRGIVVKISGSDDNYFIEEKDIRSLIAKDRALSPVGMPVSNINIAVLETIVVRDPWVKDAEIFIDNQYRLHVKVTQREPIARVFTITGNSFYLDEERERIPVSERYTARVPVFTGFPSDAQQLQKADSLLATNIVDMGHFLLADKFWMAQVEQVTITGDRKFEIIPKLGDHIIAFGEGTDIDRKFSKLLAFYKEGLSRVGWNNYSRVNVAFENEVVCTRKDGKEPPKPVPPQIDSADIDLADDEHAAGPEAPAIAKVAPVVEAPVKKPAPKRTARPAAGKAPTKKAGARPKKQPKAVYKPVHRSVNTTKNNKKP